MTRIFIFAVFLSISLAAGQAISDEYIVELEAGPSQRSQAWAAKARLRSELRGESIDETASFDRVLNAVAVRADAQQRARLSRMPGVKKVYAVREYKPLLDRALVVHGAPSAWERLGGAERAGEGIKIGIIDTGIDVTHPGFQDPNLAAPEGFPKLLREADASFTSGKVIVARSYQGSSADDILGHGTSVAMAAAGVVHDAPLGRISGVAPKAWLGNYKVFRDGGGAPTTAIITALEDAIADGMDVVNLSLGSDVAEDPGDDPLVQAVESAVRQGIIVVVAAGNAGPDPMTIGSPASAPSAITVGNSSNDRDFAGALGLEDGRSYAALPGDNSADRESVSGTVKSVYGLDPSGLACDAFPADSFSGTIAFLARGVCTFEQKFNNVQQAGAVGAIVYTDAARPQPIPMAQASAQLPGVMISYADGIQVRQALEQGAVQGTLRFTVGPVAIDPNRLDGVSSRGPNVNFSIKPDLSGVGSPLYTALAGGGYTTAVGTSLSAPLIAGAAALAKQQYPGLTVDQYRSLVVNSARKLNITGESFTPVRMSGTGVLDLNAMTQSTLSVSPVSLSFGLASTAGDISREVKFTNLGTTADTFLLSVDSIGRPISPGLSTSTVHLEPGATETVHVTIPLPALAGGTIEGYIVAKSGNTGVESRVAYWLGVPYEVPRYLKLLEVPATGTRGTQQTLLFRTLDENGIPVHQIQPEVTASTAGAEVISVDRSDLESPGSYKAVVRLTFLRGTNTFSVRVGDLTREISIMAQ